jgi:hypothetical protein
VTSFQRRGNIEKNILNTFKELLQVYLEDSNNMFIMSTVSRTTEYMNKIEIELGITK